jgi:hypothetical protein
LNYFEAKNCFFERIIREAEDMGKERGREERRVSL